MPDRGVHYDRTALVRSVVDCTAPVQVITGPSGIGKSDILDAASQADVDRIAPSPVRLRRSAGSLQQGLIRSLGEAVCLIAEEHGNAATIGRHLSDAARRMASNGLKDIAKVVGKELLAVVRGRIGESVGDAVGEYLADLKASYDERLEARLSAAADPDVVDMLIAFAEETADLAGGAEIVLSFDNGDALDDQDMRILSDLVSELPNRVRLRVAFATDRQRQAQLDQLVAAGAAETPVPVLSEREVSDWLQVVGLSPDFARQIHRVTDGYPLHLEDMIDHVSSGGAIDNAPINDQFARRTRASWNALDAPIAIVARKIAAFPEPVTSALVTRFLGLDASAWAELEDRLWRSGMFSGSEPGQRWFHEQRRRFIWTSILTDAERSALAEAAVDELRREVEEHQRLEYLPALARVATEARDLRAREAGLEEVLSLSQDALAVAAALVELSERAPGNIAVLGETLLTYARERFLADGDLIAALESLEQCGLVTVASNENATAVVPRWQSNLTVLVLGGRASAELGRLPIPSAASTFFQLNLIPRLGPFVRAQYGIGHPSIAVLSQQAAELRRHSANGTVTIGRPGPDLLVTGSYAGVPVYASATFNTSDDRDAARQAMADLDIETAADRLRLMHVIDHPYTAVPSLRFLAAAELLLGTSLPYGSPRLRLSRPLDPEESLLRRLAAYQAIHRLSNEDERLAMEIDEEIGYLLAVAPNGLSTLTAEVRGGRNGVQQIHIPSNWNMSGPYARFALGRDARLLPSERLGRMTIRGGEPSDLDPVVELLAELSKRAASYNRHATPARILFEDNAIAGALETAERRLYQDAATLAASVRIGDGGHAVPLARKTSLLLYPDSRPGFVPGYGLVVYVHQDAPSGSPEVDVHIGTPRADPPTRNEITDDLRTHFDLGPYLDAGRPGWRSAASPGPFIEMLGYARAEVRLVLE